MLKLKAIWWILLGRTVLYRVHSPSIIKVDREKTKGILIVEGSITVDYPLRNIG